MSVKEFLSSLGIEDTPEKSENGSYVVSLKSSNDFGRMFTKLEKADDLSPLEDNQVVTEQGSSLMYESESEPYLVNLLADFDGDVYELIVTEIGD